MSWIRDPERATFGETALPDVSKLSSQKCACGAASSSWTTRPRTSSLNVLAMAAATPEYSRSAAVGSARIAAWTSEPNVMIPCSAIEAFRLSARFGPETARRSIARDRRADGWGGARRTRLR